MILIPIGQEDNTVRRLPWVTFSIMIACVIAFVLTGFGSPPVDEGATEALEEAIDYFMMHPYLELPEELDKIVFQGATEEMRETLLESLKPFAEKPPTSDLERQAQQDHLNELSAKGLAGVYESGFFKWGLVPSQIKPLSLFTHMFLHGGFGHIIGNLLILFLAGPFVEDVWGRPLYASFYVVSGIVAALSWVVAHPDVNTPMIGASGAIAGVMGAFLVRHFANRIRFFYMVGFLIRGTFLAPAWLMLPLWFGEQLFMYLMIKGSGIQGGGGIAYMAHIGGFAFGVVAAIVVKKARIEERFVSSAIEEKITVVDNKVIEEALAAVREGRADAAYTMLAEAWKKDPSNRDVALTLWDVAVDQQWAAHAAPAMVRVVQEELRAGEPEEALNHWFELISKAPSLAPEAQLCVRMAQMLQQGGHSDWAVDALRRALAADDGRLAGGLLVRVAKQAHSLDPSLAAQAAQAALAKPDLHPDERGIAESILSGAAAPVPAIPT